MMWRKLLVVLLLIGSPAVLAQLATPRIAFLGPGHAKTYATFIAGLREGLEDNGLIEGRDYVLDVLWAEGRYDRFPALVDEAMRRQPKVIVPGTIAAVQAAARATSTIPIVMPGINDPVGSRLITSLARPGRNITGVATLMEDSSPKLIDVLREVIPQAKRVAMIVNPDNPSNRKVLDSMQIAARSVGVTIDGIELRDPTEIDLAFATLSREGSQAILVARDAGLLDAREEISGAALKRRIPLIASQMDFADAGALIGYGASTRDNFRRSAAYVKKVLAGANPAELPVEQPTKFVLAINLRTAKALGITISQSLLSRADEVIR